MYKGAYVPPTLTVDGVVFQLDGDQLSVLLIKRTQEPFKNTWALPGGYNAAGETTQEALARVMDRKAGVKTKDLSLIEQLYTFDTVARDPRGHAVSVVYMGLGRELSPQNSPTAQSPTFFPLSALPELAYDHKSIIVLAHERLQSKLGYTNAVYALLPSHFTLTQLQSAYEAILGRELDKRNFRKKFMSLDLIEATDEMLKDGAHRPARLYKFLQNTLQSFARNFD